jgi:beta-lactamase regulating signal transducer with metallopeptidase domain/protocatechuate 3,4-dioxygenase beta subunit
MFELCVRWLAWGLDTSLKALLVALVAATLLKLLRFRDSNIRHRVWTGVLAGMLALPVLSPLMPALRLPLVPSPEWLIAWTAEPALSAATAEATFADQHGVDPQTPTLPDAASPNYSLNPIAIRQRQVPSQGFPAPDAFSPSEIISNEPRLPAAQSPEIFVEPSSPAPLPPSLARHSDQSIRAVAIILVVVVGGTWLVVSAFLGLRLAIGLWMASRVRRGSIEIDAADLPPGCIASGAVRECSSICVPLTVGALSPQILLPQEWRKWPIQKLHAVLAHEQMHVQRADCAVALAAEINCCLYWFHPLAWWLKQQLAALAEQACDDAAIHSIGNRTQYARHLLEVAADVSRQRGRLAPSGVSMARRFNVETRIHAILDFRRPLSRRLSWASTCAILALMVPLIALTAALKPSSGQQAAGNAGSANKAGDDAAKSSKPSTEPQAPKTFEQRPANDQPPILESTFTFAGTVIDDRSQPVPGATISLGYSSNMPADETLRRLAVSDERGHFTFTRKTSDLVTSEYPRAWAGAELIASKDGYGFGIGPLPYLETSGRLVADQSDREHRIAEYYFGKPKADIVVAADDVPIRGRIVDSEGKPVAGATVAVADAWRGQRGSLDDWQTAATAPGADEPTTKQHLAPYSQSGRSIITGELSAPHALVVPTVRSDANGRFTLTGIGHERIVELQVSGPGIATMSVLARSRQGDVIRVAKNPASLEDRMLVYHPAEFTCIATPSVPVHGRVTDRRTGEPLADFLVQGTFEAAAVHTKTDAEGRYRLEGFPLGENTVRVAPPKKSGYFAAEVQATTALGGQPAIQDVALSRGVVVRGRVTDTTTGKPVNGTIQYFAFINNPHLRASPGFELSDEHYSANDGRYEIPVLPGPGLLTFTAWPDEYFPRGVGADKIDGPKSVTNAVFFRTEPYLVTPGNCNLLTAINPAADASEINLDLSLTSGRSLNCRLRRADGQPLQEYYVYGRQAFAGWDQGHSGETLHIHGYFPEIGRRVMVYHPEGNLVGWKDLTGEAPEDFEISLKPGGTLIGRVLDDDGSPLEGITIGSAWGEFTIADRYSPAVAKTWGELPASLEGRRTLTNKDGRFELPGAIPGLEYTAAASGKKKMNGQVQTMSLGTIFKAETVVAGQTKDLGDLKIKPRQTTPKETDAKPTEKVQQSNSNPEQAKAASAPNAPTVSDLHGRVVDDTGKSLAGAKLYAFHSRVSDVTPMKPRLIATTNAAGEFSLASPLSVPDGDHDQANWRSRESIVIIAPGHGFLVTSRDEITRQPPAGNLLGALFQAVTGNSVPTVRLPPAGETIRGRLVDIDGRPVAGATVKIRWFEDIVPARLNRPVGDIAKSDWQVRVNHLLRVIEPVQLRDLLPQATTDARGRFELRDLGSNRLFQLLIQSQQTESVDLVVRNLSGDSITIPPERNFRAYEVTLLPREFDRALGPSKPVTGRVVDLDTGEPIASAMVRAFAVHGINLHSSRERQEFATRTDRDGRYRITGLPIGNENHLAAFATGDVPYIPISHQIDTSQSGDVHQDFRLKRGIWATGRVYDAETDKPFVGQISYYWFRNRELEQQIPGLRRAFVDELYWTNGNGEFRLPVLPTRGILAFRYAGMARDRDGIDRFARGAGADSIEGSQAMGALKSFATMPSFLIPTNYERVAEVKPDPGQTTVRVDLPLFASPPVKIRVVDAEGNAVPGCEVYGANERWGWREQQTAEFSLEDLRSGERRKVLAFHRLINMAGGVIVSRDDPQPIEIKLAPAGSITGRLVDKSGQAITDAELHADYDKLKTDGPSAIWANHPTLYSNPTHIPVDENGRFRLDGLIPGWSYNAYATAPRKLNGQMIRNFVIGTAFDDVRTGPGEKRDLGDITIDVK